MSSGRSPPPPQIDHPNPPPVMTLKEYTMTKIRTLALTALLVSASILVSSCTSTNGQRSPTASLNTACNYGLHNDRPCSY
jgi:hypothetical protein